MIKFVMLSILACFATILVYQLIAKVQVKTEKIWLNPMLFSILIIIGLLSYFELKFEQYYTYSQSLNWLLEPAIVILGYPLYQQLSSIRQDLKRVTIICSSSVVFVLTISFLASQFLIGQESASVSLSLKSITTPIGISLTEQLGGIISLTAISIIIAGLTGAIFGIKLLDMCGLTDKKAQGLAIGCASHALGTATISSVSYQHGAYSSLALIFSAIITAIIAPYLLPLF